MNSDEILQEVTDLLVSAIHFNELNYPDAAMQPCRKALECIVHYCHYREHGEFPKKKGGHFPSVIQILHKSNQSIPQITSTTIESINAQTRSSHHWEHEEKGQIARQRHVKSVIEMIRNVFFDIFAVEIHVVGSTVSEHTLDRVIMDDLEEKLVSSVIELSSGEMDSLVETGKLIEEMEIELTYQQLLELARISKLRGDFVFAKHKLEEASILIPSNEHRLRIECSNMLAEIEIDHFANYQSARTHYEQSLKIAELSGDEVLKLQSLGNMGNVYMREMNLEPAMKYYLEALNGFRKLGIEHSIAVALIQLVPVYNHLGLYNQSYSSCFEANEIFARLNDISNMAFSSDLMGQILGRKDPRKAIQLHNIAIELIESLERPDILNIIGFKSNIAFRLFDLREFQQSIKTLEDVVDLSTQISYPYGISSAYTGIGKAMFELEELDSAEDFLLKAGMIAEKGGDIVNKVNSTYTRALIEERRENYFRSRQLCEEAIYLMEKNNYLANISNAKNFLNHVTGKLSD
jgi:tetratricopeptide (TPR) repeat protein